VAVGTDDERARRAAIREDDPEELEARRIGPLQIVEEEHERALVVAPRGEEAGERTAEAVLRLDRAGLGHRGLGTDEPFKLRHDVDEHLALLADPREDRRAPLRERVVAL